MERISLQERLENEIDLLQIIHDKELILRYSCGMSDKILDWKKICDVIMPNNPTLAKRRLLEYLGENEYSCDYGKIMMILNQRLGKYNLDVLYYSGIASIINDCCKDRYEEFIDALVYVCEAIKHLNPKMDYIMKLTHDYWVRNYLS